MTNTGRMLVLGAVVAAATTGCANYVWQRPGTGEMAAAQDRLECDEAGRRAATSYEASLWMGKPVAWRGQIADPWWYGSASSFDVERRTAERCAERCMEAKGYQLVRAPERSPAASPRTR